MARKHGRGISVGTILMLVLSVSTALAAGLIFARISGDMGQISIDPKLLTEPLQVLAHSVTNTEPEATAPPNLAEGGDPSPTNALNMARKSEEPVATPVPTQPPIRTLNITVAGQVSVGTELRAAAQNGGSLDFGAILAPISGAFSGSDLGIVTLRTSLTGNASQVDAYNAPKELAAGLKSAGVNLLNLATDRLLDHGMSGLSETRTAIEEAQMSAAGGYRSQEERARYPVSEIGGVKVGILSYTGSISAAGTKTATEAELASATRVLDAQTATQDIAALRGQGADLVIVLAHWGSRSDTKASKETRAMAETLAKAGADIILGTNPTSVHELERMTVMDVYGTAREVFVAYSLGNFLTDDSRDTNNITGTVLRLSVEWNAQAGKATIRDAWYMPTWIMRWRDVSGVNRYRVVPSGMAALPNNMTETIYTNMKKAYQAMVSKVGTTAANVRAE